MAVGRTRKAKGALPRLTSLGLLTGTPVVNRPDRDRSRLEPSSPSLIFLLDRAGLSPTSDQDHPDRCHH